ncbi:MAG: hypothetical protein F6J96_23465 [Symploca sp. SIO1C2]|nr:hypothetical protein [Symploca sp. SIO1C2]
MDLSPRLIAQVHSSGLISSSVEYLHFGGNKAPGQMADGRREERRLQGIREL